MKPLIRILEMKSMAPGRLYETGAMVKPRDTDPPLLRMEGTGLRENVTTGGQAKTAAPTARPRQVPALQVLRKGDSAMTTEEKLLRKRSAARFVVIGGLVLLLIAAYTSVISMLIWGPAADPAVASASAVTSGQSGQVQTDQPWRSEKLGREPGPKDPVFFDPRADEPRPMVNDLLDQHHLETHR